MCKSTDLKAILVGLLGILLASDINAASADTSGSNLTTNAPHSAASIDQRLKKIERKIDTLLTYEDKIDEILAFIRTSRDAQAKQTPAQIAKQKQEQALAAADDIVDKIETAINNDDSAKAINLIDATVAQGFDVNYNPSGLKSQSLLAEAEAEGLTAVVRHLKELGAREGGEEDTTPIR